MTLLTDRAYTAAHFALVVDFDGQGGASENWGFLKSVEGGGCKSEPITYQQGGSLDLWRWAGRPKYEDLTIQIGMGMSRRFYHWIEDFFERKMTRKNGAILTSDAHYKARSSREFKEAQITEVTFPALDGSDKNPGYLTVKIAAESMAYKTHSADPILQPLPGIAQQKYWKPANFNFDLDGFDPKTMRVPKIDGFTIKQTPIDDKVGNRSEARRVPGRVEWPNLSVYIPEHKLGPWWEWQKKALIDGKPGRRRMGHIQLLAPDCVGVLLTITLHNVGILGITPEKAEAGSDQLKKAKVELFVEKMTLEYPGPLEKYVGKTPTT